MNNNNKKTTTGIVHNKLGKGKHQFISLVIKITCDWVEERNQLK